MHYLQAYNDLYKTEEGRQEIRWVLSIPPFEEQTVVEFYLEYVWVVINAGMKEQVARKIYNKFLESQDPTVIGHLGKRKAIISIRDHATDIWDTLLKCGDKLSCLEMLPWIGPVTKYHLARNLGLDVVKPDRHLVRLAAHFGYESPDTLCRTIQEDLNDGTKLGEIDLVLWRYTNLHGPPSISDQSGT